MNTTPGTRLRYVSGRPNRVGDSTVVVLRNGEVLELRRGDLTFRGRHQADRRKWPSVTAWRATLPPGAKIQTDDDECVEQPPQLHPHPDIDRMITLLKENGVTLNQGIFGTLSQKPTRTEILTRLQSQFDLYIQRIHDDKTSHSVKHWLTIATMIQKQIETVMSSTSYSDRPEYILQNQRIRDTLVLYGQAAAGEPLEGIYVNSEAGKFAIKNDRGEIIVAERLTEFGFTYLYLNVGGSLVRF
jgi:hypothetical protein